MKRTTKIIIAVIALVVLGAAVVLIIGIKNYVDECPVINVKKYVSAEVGDTLSITDLADITNAVESKILNEIICDYDMDAKVINDGQRISVGYLIGEFSVVIWAKGENGATRTETVQIGVCIVD